jgi:uncharacterized membrane-anchored protein YhcB (DUF1043 family)
MAMDWQQAAISCGAVVVTAVIARAKKSGKDEKEMETVKEDIEDHDERLNEHDNRFAQLNTIFMPRTELQETFKAIQKSNDRQERMLEALILPRVNPINPDEGN